MPSLGLKFLRPKKINNEILNDGCKVHVGVSVEDYPNQVKCTDPVTLLPDEAGEFL